MSADIVKFGEAAAQYERDRKAFRRKIEGASVREIAAELGCTMSQVQSSLVRMLGGVTPALRAQMLAVDLERLEKMFEAVYPHCVPKDPDEKPDPEMIGAAMRMMERRAKFLGLDAPPTGVGPGDANPNETSIERIKRALDLVKGNGTTIDNATGQPVEEETH